MAAIFLMIHIFICILLFFLQWAGVLKIRALVLPTVVFVPFFGLLIFFGEEYAQRRGHTEKKEVGIEKLKVNDAKYRRIEVDRGENQDITVPLEEAVMVNDTSVRRKLMLDILQKKPEDYIDLLKRTRFGTDAELTHYATTTMMEIQSRYEQNIQRFLEDMQREPENRSLLGKCSKEIENYINSGLISGNIRMIYRKRWNGVLEKLVEIYPENKAYRLKKIGNQIDMGELGDIERQLNEAENIWQKDEAVFQLFVKYYRHTGQGGQITELLRQIKTENIYLSHEGKEWFAFWSHEEPYNE